MSTFAEILRTIESGREKKISRKLPEWAEADARLRGQGAEGLEFPSDLSLEQCSSSGTASYKAGVAASCEGVAGGVVTDITGGLGVDSLAFSGVAAKVHYFERNPGLVKAAMHNFRLLGADNVDFSCTEVSADTPLPESDLVFADPARRDGAGRKVFRLEDCTPDVSGLLPLLLDRAPHVLLKLSPMADISMLAAMLGPQLREVHVVSAGGEVKELLCLLGRGWSGGYVITVADSVPLMSFRPEDESGACMRLAGSVSPGDMLLVPSAGLLKSGAFKLVCGRYGLGALDRSTHMYVPEDAGSLPDARLFGRFEIREVVGFGRAGLRYVGEKYPAAEVTARNMRMGSDELRRRLGVRSGGEMHIFGCSTACGGTLLLVAAPVVAGK